jgi:hypothetical protein
MDIRFYRCMACHQPDEYNLLMKRHSCRCGAKKVSPTVASTSELIWFIIKHPSYLIKALKGEKLYGESNDSMSDK